MPHVSLLPTLENCGMYIWIHCGMCIACIHMDKLWHVYIWMPIGIGLSYPDLTESETSVLPIGIAQSFLA